MDCYICAKELIWGGDHSYEESGLEGEGIVTNLSCSNESCEVDTVLVYRDLNHGLQDWQKEILEKVETNPLGEDK